MEIIKKQNNNKTQHINEVHGTFACPAGESCQHVQCVELRRLWRELTQPKKPKRITKVDRSSFKGRSIPCTKYSTWYAPRLIKLLQKSHFARRQEIFFSILAECDFDPTIILSNKHLCSVIKFYPTWNLVRQCDKDRHEYYDKTHTFKVVLPARVPKAKQDLWREIIDEEKRYKLFRLQTQGNSRPPSPRFGNVAERRQEIEVDWNDNIQWPQPNIFEGYIIPDFEDDDTVETEAFIQYSMIRDNVRTTIEEGELELEPYFTAAHIPQGVEYVKIRVHQDCFDYYNNELQNMYLDDEEVDEYSFCCDSCREKLNDISVFYLNIAKDNMFDYTILMRYNLNIETQAYATWNKVKNFSSNLADKIKNAPHSAAKYMSATLVESITKEASTVAKNMYKTIKQNINELANSSIKYVQNINWADALFKTTLIMFNLIASFICGGHTRVVALINLFALLGREVVKALWPLLKKVPSMFQTDDVLNELGVDFGYPDSDDTIFGNLYDEVELDDSGSEVNIETQGLTQAFIDIRQKIAAFSVATCSLAQSLEVDVANFARKVVLLDRAITSVGKLYDFANNAKEVLLDFLFEKWYKYPRRLVGPAGVQDWGCMCQRWLSLWKQNPDAPQCAIMNNYLHAYGLYILSQSTKAPFLNKVQMWLKLLELAKGMSTKDTLMKERIRPGSFCILMHGEAGSGKSFFTQALSRFLVAKYLFQKNPEPYIYRRNVDQEYWDGYRNQFITLYDDFMQMVDTKAAPNKEIFEIIKTVNFSPFPLHSAAIGEKGNLFFNSPFVILNSNLSPEAMDPQSINCKDALMRRFHLVFKMEKRVVKGEKLSYIIVEKDQFNIVKMKNPKKGICTYDAYSMELLYHSICMAFEKYYVREKYVIETQLNGPTGEQILERAKNMTIKDYAKSDVKAPLFSFVRQYRKNAQDMTNEFLTIFTNATPIQDMFEKEYERLQKENRHQKELVEEMNQLGMAKETIERLMKVFEKKFLETEDQDDEENIETQGFADIKDRVLTWKEWFKYHMDSQALTVSWEHFVREAEQQLSDYARAPNKFDHGVDKRAKTFFRPILSDIPQFSLTASVGKSDEVVERAREIVKQFLEHNSTCTESLSLKNFAVADLSDDQVLYFIVMIAKCGFVCMFCNAGKAGIKVSNKDPYTTQHFYHDLRKTPSNFKFRDENNTAFDTNKQILWGTIKIIGLGIFLSLVQILGVIVIFTLGSLMASSIMNLIRNNVEAQSTEGTAKVKPPTRSVAPRIQEINQHGARPTSQGAVVNPYKEAREVFNAKVDERFNYPQADSNLFDQAKNVHKQIVQVCVERENRITHLLHGLVISDKLLLVPSHLHEMLDDDDLIVLRLIGNSTVKFKYNEVVKRVLVDNTGKDHDSMLIVLPFQMPGMKYLVNKFAKASSIINNVQPHCVLVSTTQESNIVIPQYHFGNDLTLHEKHVNHTMRYSRRDDGPHVYVLPKYWSYTMNTANTYCGSVLMAHNPRLASKIIGIHVGADTRRQYAVADVITSEMIEHAISELKFIDTQSGFDPLDNEYVTPSFVSEEVLGFGVKIEDEKIVDERFIPGTRAFGEVTNRRTSQPKNELEPTEMYMWTGKAPPRVPALLAPTVINGELVDPLMKAAVKVAKPDVYIDPELIDKAVGDYTTVLVSCPPPSSVNVLTIDEAVFGIDGEQYINSFNVQSSAGIPLKWECKKQGKQDFVDLENKILRADIRQQAEELEKRILQRKWDIQVCEDILKMEKRPLEKVALGKTRLFSTCPFVFNILVKRYFGRFIAWFMDNRIKNESAIGIDPHSIEWGCLYRYLDKYPNIIAGDFGNYDGSLRRRITDAVRRVMLEWYERYDNNINKDEQYVRWVLLGTIFSSAHFINGVVIFWPHSNPSGQLLTSIVNTIANSLVCRIAFYIVAQKQGVLASFSENVNMIAFGDDNALSVRDTCLSWFTPDAFARAFDEIGMEYTDETKSGLPIFKKLTDIRFLKRSFDPVLGHVFAPLELEVVLEIPCWKRRKTGFEEFCLGLRAFTIELAHHRKNVYDYWYKKFMNELAKTKYKCPPHLNYVEQRKIFRGLSPDPFYMVSSNPVVLGEE